ncbi:hypothetical protein PRK78_003718 [Emydomyces testavorans]|uniref:Nuclear membrane fusion protein Kar5 n=1 Tax=Emydomyces testavorans TaxID=2070801 RepID=A0AAF0DJQ4_9EURO|nr:hypothetical protein PRK78_003718 [Emydomyces testavorans]
MERNEIYSEAIQLLNSMQSSPSCHQRAVTDLVTSCQFLEGGPNDHDRDSPLHLDHFKSLYAARLAVCELSGAGAAVPDKCAPIIKFHHEDVHFQSSNENSEPNFNERLQIVSVQLESCLRALESRPQWWTSYSNNRQNAAVMCQAARFDIERDELLKRHRKLADITFGLSASLNQSLNDAAIEAIKQRSFLNVVNEIRLKIVRDMHDADSLARNRFSSFITDLETQIRRVRAGAKESMGDILSDAKTLSKEIFSSIESVQGLKESVNEAYAEALKKSSELAALERENQEANFEIALAVRLSLNEIRSEDMVRINEEFGHFHSSLRSLNELVFSMHQKQTALDEVSFPYCPTRVDSDFTKASGKL